MKVTTLTGQSLLDIAIQVYGTVAGVIDIALANNLSITDLPPAGTVLEVPEKTFNKAIADYYSKNHLMPATGEASELSMRIFTEEFKKQFM